MKISSGIIWVLAKYSFSSVPITWECLLNGGFPKDFEKIDVESRLLNITEIACSASDLGFEGVDIIIPVYNNNVHLAFVFIGDIEEEGEGMSPVLKHLNFIQTISSIIIVAVENIQAIQREPPAGSNEERA